MQKNDKNKLLVLLLSRKGRKRYFKIILPNCDFSFVSTSEATKAKITKT